MVVEPPPDAAARAERRRLCRAPLDPRALDMRFLGNAVALTRRRHRNAALHAAYLAAATDAPIGLPYIAHAVWRELAKEGRELNSQDLGALAAHLPSELTDED